MNWFGLGNGIVSRVVRSLRPAPLALAQPRSGQARISSRFKFWIPVALGALVALGATLRTYQLKIGDTVVEGEVVDGKIAGDKWVVINNELVQIHVEATPIPDPASDGPAGPSAAGFTEPALRLLFSPGGRATKLAPMRGLHGLMYMAGDLKAPALAKTNLVDIYSSADNSRIAVMVEDNGPIYSSTNSGVTWDRFDGPGQFRFHLQVDAEGGGFIAAATIRPSRQNQNPPSLPVPRSPATNWYAVATAPDGSQMVLAESTSPGVPALSIRRSAVGLVLSWPGAFTGYVLQSNGSLASSNWVDVPNPVSIVASENQVLIPSPAGQSFYRLRSQQVQQNNQAPAAPGKSSQ